MSNFYRADSEEFDGIEELRMAEIDNREDSEGWDDDTFDDPMRMRDEFEDEHPDMDPDYDSYFDEDWGDDDVFQGRYDE